MITREFKLYLNAGVGVAPVINVNQFDQDEEWIFTLLQSDGTVYTPSTGAIIGLKQDGTTILNAGTVNSSGQVVITETEQMTAVPGSNLFEILIDGNSHGTANFVVFVERRPGDIDNPSESDISLFQEAIDAAGNIEQFQADISALQSGLATTNANLTSEANTRASADATLQSNISAEASTRQTQDAVLQAEIDQLIAPTGEAPSAAEVQNARIGVDGTTYDTLGNAIRGQVGDLKNALNGVENAVGYSADNKFNTKVLKSNNNTAITNHNDGTYTVGNTDYGVTVFGDYTTLESGTYLLSGVPCGRMYLAESTDLDTAIVENRTSSVLTCNIQSGTYALVFKITSPQLPSEPQTIIPFFGTPKTKYDDAISSIDADIEALQENKTDISDDIQYTSGHYIKPNGDIGDLASYKISDLITLLEGEKITIYANGGTANVVSILSKWSENGTVFIENLYTCTGNVYETIEHTATEKEYLKICYLGTKNLPVVNIYEPANTDIIVQINQLENDTMKLYADISMFDDIAVCGDSYTAGEIYSSGTLIGANEKTRWGTVLSRMTGADVATYASGGADTNTWQSRSDCLPKLLNDSPHELYILCLGINDKTYVTLGSASDMEHAGTESDPFPNTFYGNYASIITQIKNHAPNAKIIISKVFIVTLVSGQYYQWSSEAIEEIANYFNIPFIETANADFFSSNWFNSNMRSGHPIAPTYTGIAKAMKYLISKCILENTSYFADYYPN